MENPPLPKNKEANYLKISCQKAAFLTNCQIWLPGFSNGHFSVAKNRRQFPPKKQVSNFGEFRHLKFPSKSGRTAENK